MHYIVMAFFDFSRRFFGVEEKLPSITVYDYNFIVAKKKSDIIGLNN